MKEIEVNRNIQPKVPAVFTETFVNGFEIPKPETEIDQIAGQINRRFIARKLDWRDRMQMMSE